MRCCIVWSINQIEMDTYQQIKCYYLKLQIQQLNSNLLSVDAITPILFLLSSASGEKNFPQKYGKK